MTSRLTSAAISAGTGVAGCITSTPDSVSLRAAGAAGSAPSGSATDWVADSATGSTWASAMGSAVDSVTDSAAAICTGSGAFGKRIGATATLSAPRRTVPSAKVAIKDNRRGASEGKSVNTVANCPLVPDATVATSCPSRRIETLAAGSVRPASVVVPSSVTRSTSMVGVVRSGDSISTGATPALDSTAGSERTVSEAGSATGLFGPSIAQAAIAKTTAAIAPTPPFVVLLRSTQPAISIPCPRAAVY